MGYQKQGIFKSWLKIQLLTEIQSKPSTKVESFHFYLCRICYFFLILSISSRTSKPFPKCSLGFCTESHSGELSIISRLLEAYNWHQSRKKALLNCIVNYKLLFIIINFQTYSWGICPFD